MNVGNLPEGKSQKLVVHRKKYYKTNKNQNSLQIKTSHLKPLVLTFSAGWGGQGFSWEVELGDWARWVDGLDAQTSLKKLFLLAENCFSEN